MKVALLDYGVGNVASVRRALSRLGAEVDLTSRPEVVAAASRVVLPGVGAFAPARERLKETGLDEALRVAVEKGARLLGLCLGFQLLFEESSEFGVTPGLGLLPGRVTGFPVGVRVPHIGWNALQIPGKPTSAVSLTLPPPGKPTSGVSLTLPPPGKPTSGVSRMLADVPSGAYVYFVHSFRAEGVDPDSVAAWCDYGGRFPAAVERGGLWGCQFHPEKSSDVGRAILGAFLAPDVEAA